jgi:hypothetical protein
MERDGGGVTTHASVAAAKNKSPTFIGRRLVFLKFEHPKRSDLFCGRF